MSLERGDRLSGGSWVPLPSLYEGVLGLMLEIHPEPDIVRIHFSNRCLPCGWNRWRQGESWMKIFFIARLSGINYLGCRVPDLFIELLVTHGVSQPAYGLGRR